jgi:3'-5' exoribonuclease
MANVLDLRTVKDGSILTDSIVYLANYKKLPKKDGKSFYISGTFTNREDSLSFKVWDAPLIDFMSENDMTGQVVKINGSASSYQNNIDVKLTSIEAVDESVCPKSTFLKSADVESLFKEFTDFVNAELSPNAVKVLLGIFKNENLFPRFKEEFAGNKMHDAQIGGLLNHTVKMMKIGKVVYENEPRMTSLQYFKDMFFLSIILHDIGKVYEMNFGVYQENSFVTHRILGIEMLVKYKSAIVELFDENFYYEIVSVLQGHHGEFGDAPVSVLAYLVHLIDMLDSQTTGIFDKIESNDVVTRANNMTVMVNGKYLVV